MLETPVSSVLLIVLFVGWSWVFWNSSFFFQTNTNWTFVTWQKFSFTELHSTHFTCFLITFIRKFKQFVRYSMTCQGLCVFAIGEAFTDLLRPHCVYSSAAFTVIRPLQWRASCLLWPKHLQKFFFLLLFRFPSAVETSACSDSCGVCKVTGSHHVFILYFVVVLSFSHYKFDFEQFMGHSLKYLEIQTLNLRPLLQDFPRLFNFCEFHKKKQKYMFSKNVFFLVVLILVHISHISKYSPVQFKTVT